MNLSQPVRLARTPDYFFICLLFIGIMGGVFCFSISYLYHSNVILGALLFPFVLFVDGSRRNNYAYLLCIGLLIAIATVYNIRIAYFFALALFFIWLTEYFVGRCNSLIVFLIAFMSPFFLQITTILGFALRLNISSLAGAILKGIGMDVSIEGNIIILDGSTFSVDEACMGLSMLSMSMLMGLFVLAYRYRLTEKRLNLLQIGGFFFIAFFLNLVTNLLRIVVLVLFKIPPENYLHELIGVLSFIFYTAAPLYLLSGWFLKRGTGISRSDQQPQLRVSVHKKVMLMTFALVMLAVGVRVNEEKLRSDVAKVNVRSAYGIGDVLHDGVVKITTSDLLIYVKPIREFFSGEHTPLICWKGSGYVFQGIREIDIAGRRVYVGRLTKENDILYTGWWYTNGKVETNSQLEWRVRMLKGEAKFCLVNVTAKDESVLIGNINSIFQCNMLDIQQNESQKSGPSRSALLTGYVPSESIPM